MRKPQVKGCMIPAEGGKGKEHIFPYLKFQNPNTLTLIETDFNETDFRHLASAIVKE